jgi:hypothetical protein
MQAHSNISTFSCNRVEKLQTIIRGEGVNQARSEAARGQPAAVLLPSEVFKMRELVLTLSLPEPGGGGAGGGRNFENLRAVYLKRHTLHYIKESQKYLCLDRNR